MNSQFFHLLIIGAIVLLVVFVSKPKLIFPFFLWVIAVIISLVLSTAVHPALIGIGIFAIGSVLHFAYFRSHQPGEFWLLVFKTNTYIIFGIYFTIFAAQACVHGGRARQSEPKTNLASIATSEISYYAEKGTFSNSFEDIGWAPQGETKYAYFITGNKKEGEYFPAAVWGKYGTRSDWEYENNLGSRDRKSFIRYQKPVENYLPSLDDALQRTIGEYGVGASATGFTAIAIGNIDDDDVLDVWIIHETKTPINVVNDTFNDGGQILPEKKLRNYGIFNVWDRGFVIWLDKLSFVIFLLSAVGLVVLFSYNRTKPAIEEKTNSPAD